jgi:predicted nucleic acid binding AN1-type Zn finger protein
MNKNCEYCNKKSLVIFDCKCSKHFCTHHRLPEKHNCMKIYEIQRHQYLINEKNLIDNSIKPSSFVKFE